MNKIGLFLFLFLTSYSFTFSQVLVSEGKTSWASSVEGGNVARYGNDGNEGTRWESNWGSDPNPDDAWWAVDLGSEYHISRVEFLWENAYAKEYAIELSNDREFSEYTELAHVTNGSGGSETVPTNINPKGRYLRMRGIERAMGYGYSFYECRVFGLEELTAVPIRIEVPYVQYLKLSLSPEDLNGTEELIIQNTDQSFDLMYNESSPLSVSLLDFRGDYHLDFWALEEGSETDTIVGVPLNVVVYKDMVIHIRLTPKITFGNQAPVADAGANRLIYYPENSVRLDGSRSIDADGEIISYNWSQVSGPAEAFLSAPNEAITMAENLQLGDYKFRLTVVDDSLAVGYDDVIVTVSPPEQVDFLLSYPADKAMVTDTRRPSLTWEAVPGATKYEIFVNITRNDYEWYSSGNLLDRYTKVGESATDSFTLTSDLVDRWTYKWYVIATTPEGMKYSEKKQFGLYIPVLEQENDGIDMVDGCRDLNKNGIIEPFENWRLTPEERLDDLMSRLTTEEKIAQLFYGGNDEPLDGFAFSYGVESGMRESQYAASKTRMGIPIAFLGDKAHGWKTIYPTQIGLAAARDMDLVYQCGNLHRIEQKSFGFTGTLAPVAEVNTKVLYPRIQEGCGENAEEAAAMIRAIVCGMQGGPEVNPHSMMVTMKHWPSQGAGGESTLQYDEVTIKYHMKPWYAAMDANAVSVMPGYNTCPYLDPVNGANTSKKVIDYLRKELGFDGFVVTDWLAANTEQSVKSISAGVDVLGGAPSSSTDFDALLAAVGMERIDEAVRRVLDVKIRMGMLENPYGDPDCTWTNEEHHEIVLNAARKSITLLKNDDLLPLKPGTGESLLVTGPLASWAHQNNDPNVIWQSVYYDNPQARTFLQAIQKRAGESNMSVVTTENQGATTAMVVIGENAYTHGTEWADKNPNIPEEQLSIIRNLKEAGVKVITVIVMPRPYVLTPLIELSDAMMAVYRGGNGIGQAVAECIFGDFAPSGKLPFQLPRSQAQVGTDNENDQLEKWELPYDLGATDAERLLIYNYIKEDQMVPPIFGDPLFQYGFGIQGFGVDDDTPPLAFNLISPENNAVWTENSVTLTWEASSDPESSISFYEIYLNDSKRASVTNTSYKLDMLDEGHYSWYVVAVNGAGLTTQSPVYEFSFATSDVSAERENKIAIYPNPFTNYIQMEIPGVKDACTVRLLDITGHVLREEKTETGTLAWNMEAYPSGFYFLSLTGKEKSWLYKIIKK